MSDKREKRRPTGDYAQGYARPPKATQFQPGQSGNLKGRPRKKQGAPITGSKMDRVIVEEGNRLVEVTEGGIKRKMPMKRVLARRSLTDQATGAGRFNWRALKVIAEAEDRTRQENKALADLVVGLRADWVPIVRHFEAKGEPLPNLGFDPLDLSIDEATYEIRLEGKKRPKMPIIEIVKFAHQIIGRYKTDLRMENLSNISPEEAMKAYMEMIQAPFIDWKAFDPLEVY